MRYINLHLHYIYIYKRNIASYAVFSVTGQCCKFIHYRGKLLCSRFVIKFREYRLSDTGNFFCPEEKKIQK